MLKLARPCWGTGEGASAAELSALPYTPSAYAAEQVPLLLAQLTGTCVALSSVTQDSKKLITSAKQPHKRVTCVAA